MRFLTSAATIAQEGPSAGEFDTRDSFVPTAALGIGERGAFVLRHQQRAQSFETIRCDPSLRAQFAQRLLDAGGQQSGFLDEFAKEERAFSRESLQNNLSVGRIFSRRRS